MKPPFDQNRLMRSLGFTLSSEVSWSNPKAKTWLHPSGACVLLPPGKVPYSLDQIVSGIIASALKIALGKVREGQSRVIGRQEEWAEEHLVMRERKS